MNETLLHSLHDLRRLRWWILIWLALNAGLPPRFPVSDIPFLSPIGAGVLLMLLAPALARQHSLGDCSWWLTRPLTPNRLAASKLLSLLVLVVLGLVGEGIRLALEGFHPLAILLFQIEAIPLTLAAGLAMLLLCGFSRTWWGLAPTLVFVAMVILCAVLLLPGWKEEIVAGYAHHFSHFGHLSSTASTTLAESQYYHRFGRWLDWRRDSGFIGGVALCIGFWLVARFRYEKPRHLQRGILGFALVLAASLIAKVALNPMPSYRPTLSDDRPLFATIIGTESGFDQDEGGSREESGRDSDRFFLNLPLEIKGDASFIGRELAGLEVVIDFESASETSPDVRDESNAKSSRSLAGHDRFRGFEFGDLEDMLGRASAASQERQRASAVACLWIDRGIARELSGRSFAVSTRERGFKNSVRLSEKTLWATLPFEAGSSFARGAHRLEIIETSVSRIPGRDTEEETDPNDIHSARLNFKVLRFRCQWNPGKRLYSEPDGTQWRVALVDDESAPVGPGNRSPYGVEDLATREGHGGKAWISQRLDSEPAGLAVVRAVPKGRRRLVVEAQTLTIPVFSEETILRTSPDD